jgi:hypothetical protein
MNKESQRVQEEVTEKTEGVEHSKRPTARSGMKVLTRLRRH